MSSSYFSHTFEDIGTNYMSNNSSDVLVLRGEPFFQKWELQVLFFCPIYIKIYDNLKRLFSSFRISSQTVKNQTQVNIYFI